MQLKVSTTKVTVVEDTTLNRGEYRANTVQFEFGSAFDSLVKVAVFTRGRKNYEVPVDGDEVDIPYDILRSRGSFKIGVFAYRNENDELVLRYSPEPCAAKVMEGSYVEEGDDPSDPTMTGFLKRDDLKAGANVSIDEDRSTGKVVISAGKAEIPTKVSQLENDSGFVDGDEVDDKISHELARFDHLDYRIVDSLPATGESGVRYLKKHQDDDRYEEYIYVDGSWYDIGSTEEVNLSDYYDKSQVDALLRHKADTDALDGYYTKAEVDELVKSELVPSELYERYDYIVSQATGGNAKAPYIDTGISGNGDYQFIIEGNGAGTAIAIGPNAYASSSDRVGSYMYLNSGKICYYWKDVGYTQYTIPEGSLDQTADFIFIQDKNGLMVMQDGVEKVRVDYAGNGGAVATNMWIMGVNRAETSSVYTVVHRCQINNNLGNAIMDLVPVKRKLDGAAGMYDIVSGKFFTKALSTHNDFELGNY